MKNIFRRTALVLGSAVLLFVGIAIYVFIADKFPIFSVQCPWYSFTGLYCPGCGVTRAVRALLCLDFYQAFRYNAVFILSLPFLGAYFGALAISYIKTGEDKISEKISMAFPVALLIIVIIFGILRNLPMFSFLAPTVL